MTSRLMRASDVAGLPVVSISSGEDVAEIKDVVYDGTTHTLVGFTLNKRGWFRGALRRELPAAAIAAIGPDAVMVASDDDLNEPDQASGGIASGAPTHSVMGNRVITIDGRDLGRVSGVVLSTAGHPNAVGYEVDSGDSVVFVPITAQMALSDDNLLISAEAAAFSSNDLAGFGAAVDEHRSPLDTAAAFSADQTKGTPR